MPDDVARILQFILDAPTGSVSSTALREFIGDRAHQRIESLESMGFIEVSSYDVSDDGDVRVSAYEITPTGADALSEYQRTQNELLKKIADDDAEKQRVAMEHRRDVRRDYILFLLGLVFGWVLGCFTPSDAWKWFVGLFH